MGDDPRLFLEIRCSVLSKPVREEMPCRAACLPIALYRRRGDNLGIGYSNGFVAAGWANTNSLAHDILREFQIKKFSIISMICRLRAKVDDQRGV
jgi:hypothetical protein